MTPFLDCFLIVNNEEELLNYCLESYCSLGDVVGTVSVVDNNSTDRTLEIIDSFKSRLPIVLQEHRENSHHGEMRTKAISICKSPWIFYLDSDETVTSDMREFFVGYFQEIKDLFDQVLFFKYTTIRDKYHFVIGGNGHTQRLFRNENGVHFPQSIHTEPTGIGQKQKWLPDNKYLLFDHTSCKSKEALWAKGWRYKWAWREKVPAVGDEREYIRRMEMTPENTIAPFPNNIKDLIFTGPTETRYE